MPVGKSTGINHSLMDELEALMRSRRVFREASVMCFMETWLCDNIRGSTGGLTSFHCLRADYLGVETV